MIFPVHERLVDVIQTSRLKNVHSRDLVGKIVYYSTRYLIVLEKKPVKSKCRIYAVKLEGEDLFCRLKWIKEIAREEETVFVEKKNLPTSNPNVLVPEAIKICAGSSTRCVVFKGEFEQMNFVCFDKQEIKSKPPSFSLTVFDVIPPKPGKLEHYVKKALRNNLIESIIPIAPKIIRIDLVKEAKRLIREENVDAVVFPHCSMNSDCKDVPAKVYFSTDLPKKILANRRFGIIGCDVTQKTCKILGIQDKNAKIVNTCPWRKAKFHPGPFITKCCLKRRSGWVGSEGICVEWGAGLVKVSKAVQALVDHYGLSSQMEKILM
ncbi:MAG: hypothetical protein ABIH76_04340 [Candidatus Bathyarchaeota archaeon]